MGFSLKSIGHIAKKALTAINPVSHLMYGAASGKGAGELAHDFVGDQTNAAIGGAALGAGYLAAPALGLGGAAAGAGGGMTAGLGGGLGGSLGTITSIGSGLLKAAPLALGGLQAITSAKDAKHAQQLQDEALAMARAREAQLAPLRDAGVAAALKAFQNPVTPLAAVGGYADMGNPYTHVPAGAPAAAPPTMPTQIGGVAPLRLSRIARRPA